ncbi:MAG: rhomboid family intramembrane serine protease [Alphaproteobacteria bacterium]|nr:rhomboid family intramembrane serine protease [Alphaproteobacteria bacterium]|tara:strand:+ start:7160 stop:7858 length:699 start_codon:yes stop_codon:yes gene_type:complete
MPQSRRSPPIINAPPLVTALALSLVVAHVIRLLGGQALDGFFVDVGAVFPERFWGWAGMSVGPQAYPPYGNALSALIPLVGTAFVHGSWSHLLMNAVMLVALGKPVYLVLQRVSRSVMGGNSAFLILFLMSVAAGSLVHLLTHFPVGPPAIGASGGVSGYLAAVLLLQNGPNLLSRKFLTVTVVFVVANAMLAFLGPSMFGAQIAWQAHIGGYVAGAILFRYMLTRRQKAGI